MSFHRFTSCTYLILTTISYSAYAKTSIEECVMEKYATGDKNLTLADMRKICGSPIKMEENHEEDIVISALNIIKGRYVSSGAISNRIIQERETEFKPYVITPHKINYMLPAITTNSANKKVYESFNGYEENLEDIEAKFQISLKVPLNYDSMLIEGDGLYFGFTLQAWWQIYAENISKPFRETNYQPELFYIAPLDWHPFDGNTGIVLGVEHQSNGKAQNLSRSWNRVYANLLFEKNNFALSFRPWVRLSEDPKINEFDSKGDDNPDIDDYLGNYKLAMVYKWNGLEFSASGRQNFSTNKGSLEVGLTFPLWGKLRGYATTYSGYGESLIDYNHSQTRFGLGIALNNVL
jgi:phospholipase A1